MQSTTDRIFGLLSKAVKDPKVRICLLAVWATVKLKLRGVPGEGGWSWVMDTSTAGVPWGLSLQAWYMSNEAQ